MRSRRPAPARAGLDFSSVGCDRTARQRGVVATQTEGPGLQRARGEGLRGNCHVVVSLCFCRWQVEKRGSVTFFSSNGALRAIRSMDSSDRSGLWWQPVSNSSGHASAHGRALLQAVARKNRWQTRLSHAGCRPTMALWSRCSSRSARQARHHAQCFKQGMRSAKGPDVLIKRCITRAPSGAKSASLSASGRKATIKPLPSGRNQMPLVSMSRGNLAAPQGWRG